jgi:uncharacterized protein
MRFAAACMLASLIHAPAFAQQPPAAPEPPAVVTSGEAVVKRAPDRAWVTISAESRAKAPGEAQKQNAAAMSAVVEKLKGAGIPPDAIQTTAIELQPEFDYHEGRQTLRGYVARNSVDVRVDALPKLGDLIDMSVGAGATRVTSVRFDLKDRDAAEREALKLAVADARERAVAAAAGAGLQLGRVLRIEEHRQGPVPPPRPMAMREMVAVQEATTPVAPGELEIRAAVTMTVEVK